MTDPMTPGPLTIAGLTELARYAKTVFHARGAHSFDLRAVVLNQADLAAAGLDPTSAGHGDLAAVLPQADVRFVATVVVPGRWPRRARTHTGTARIAPGGNQRAGITFALVRLLQNMGLNVDVMLLDVEEPSR